MQLYGEEIMLYECYLMLFLGERVHSFTFVQLKYQTFSNTVLVVLRTTVL